MQDQSPAPAAPTGLQIERAMAGDELVGYRLRCGNNTLLAFEDQGAMPGFRLGDNFVGAFTGPKIEYAPVGLASPPAAMPVAPSDAATTAENLHPAISHRGHFNHEGYAIDWNFNGGPRKGEPWVLGLMEHGRVFIGGVYHKELSGERCEQMVIGLEKELAAVRADLLDARVRLKSIGALQEGMQPQAEPAAGEQAGAADREFAVLVNREACRLYPDSRDDRINFGDGARWARALAAPGAAIAAREQEKAQAAINAIAALAPQLEDSVHGPRRRCQHCGHAWQTNEKEHHALNCAYVIATSVPHTPPASRDEAPATPQGEPDPLLIDSMCMRWRHDFGLQRSIDDPLSSGFTDAERDSLRSSMRQLWEEVVGRGFYRPAALAQSATVQQTAWDASDIKQPGWHHVAQAFIEGAREARANPDAADADFKRAADGYSKRVFEEVDPESERRLRTGDFKAPTFSDAGLSRLAAAVKGGAA